MDSDLESHWGDLEVKMAGLTRDLQVPLWSVWVVQGPLRCSDLSAAPAHGFKKHVNPTASSPKVLLLKLKARNTSSSEARRARQQPHAIMLKPYD